MKEGWTWIFNSPKWHYFADGRSLCGRWMLFGKGENLELGSDNSPDNCKTCVKKLKARVSKEEE